MLVKAKNSVNINKYFKRESRKEFSFCQKITQLLSNVTSTEAHAGTALLMIGHHHNNNKPSKHNNNKLWQQFIIRTNYSCLVWGSWPINTYLINKCIKVNIIILCMRFPAINTYLSNEQMNAFHSSLFSMCVSAELGEYWLLDLWIFVRHMIQGTRKKSLF